MKNLYRILSAILLVNALLLAVNVSFAGNEDRVGQAGGGELLINPWARSSGWGSVGIASTRGLEAMYSNVAGVAFTPRTEVIFSSCIWLKGSGVNINSFGITQKIGETSVIGLAFSSMSFGDIMKTTTDLPEGGIGTFSPNLTNINICYAKSFSNSIYGGINVKIISEKIDNMGAAGVAIDAGIQYITGEQENIMFGIALKNVGPRMKFSGDGLSIRGNVVNSANQMTLEQRSQDFDLPTSLNIGATYQFNITDQHKILLSGCFISNSFTKDQFALGLEYRMMEYLMLRGGYVYEKGIFSSGNRTFAYTGPSGGLTVQIPFNKEKGSTIAIDYSYRASNPWQGTHTIGARVNL
jgi:hypothetical protein